MNRRPVFEAARHPGHGPVYRFACSADRIGVPSEGAAVQFAWDETGLFVAANLEDTNPVARCRMDEQLHYQTGDVLELFVKPLNASYKWEMYVTPFGNKSTLFFPCWPTALTPEEALGAHAYRGLEVAVEQTPEGWSARMYIPAAQLSSRGAGWGDGTPWTVLCGRYNYRSDVLTDPELSMAPSLSAANYHLVDEYAMLKLHGQHPDGD